VFKIKRIVHTHILRVWESNPLNDLLCPSSRVPHASIEMRLHHDCRCHLSYWRNVGLESPVLAMGIVIIHSKKKKSSGINAGVGVEPNELLIVPVPRST